ncbi:MAG TPA: hypothetical protein VFX16_33615 [Pseudonocardiaceae bacterium]|nr:hypothetical protein [Pseudonocardiaceae bacterium]
MSPIAAMAATAIACAEGTADGTVDGTFAVDPAISTTTAPPTYCRHLVREGLIPR